MSCLPSATYAGPGSTDNLWLPADGSATIRGNLEVTGNVAVDGGLRGPNGSAVIMPSGAVGADGGSLALPRGAVVTNAGATPTTLTATSVGGQAVVNFDTGIQTQLNSYLAQGGAGQVVIGSTTGTGILYIPPQNGQGTLSAPVPKAPGTEHNMNGNKCFIQITGTGSVVVNPDIRFNGQGIPTAWNFTSNTGTIQSWFQTTSGGVTTITSTSGAQTFGVLYL